MKISFLSCAKNTQKSSFIILSQRTLKIKKKTKHFQAFSLQIKAYFFSTNGLFLKGKSSSPFTRLPRDEKNGKFNPFEYRNALGKKNYLQGTKKLRRFKFLS